MAVIVAFLFSFLNNDARAARKEIVISVLPNMSVSQLGPKTPAYLRSLAGRLRANGINALVRIMQINGGISTIENSSEFRIGLLLSGSAGGVIGGRWTGENWGKRNIIMIRYLASGFMTHESDRKRGAMGDLRRKIRPRQQARTEKYRDPGSQLPAGQIFRSSHQYR
jgi:hypothetical protein